MEKLIDQHGEAQFGIFPQSVSDINYLDFDLRNSMGKPKGSLAKKLHFNQFQFISFTCDTLIIGLAIVDLKIASNCFVYLFEPDTGKFEEFSFTNLLAFNTAIDTKPNTGSAHFYKGANSVVISCEHSHQRKVTVNLKAGLKIHAVINESVNYNPLAVCVRAGFTGFHFTQKAAALPCSGIVKWQGKKIELEQIKAQVSVDWSAGFMRRETYWNWASLACILDDGRRLGLNLAAGVVETGFTENALWLDGTLTKIDMVDFKFQRYVDKNDCTQWQLRSNDGIINLTFEPAGKRQDKTNLFIVASNFTQHFGRFYGQIALENEVITLNGEWGLTEDHYAKW
ncbi:MULTISPECIES: DUF2804 domain-containing protein [Pseudoalteromonas]|uniref:DUF2804 domain-containing protein n=1 Tax=Pseudoalteromonas TaxID=53246 RepID=UPI000311079C|nr:MULTISPECIES: DUF2804 domain-containing protein [Pseudoalteromonas]MCF6143455.1 hypothetical protein [Pseudoalteromonas mariniglutinosa NCIMB 1770]